MSPAATQRPVDSSAVVVLSAPPTQLPDGTFLSDDLASDLDNRLDALLTSGERPGVITAIDPALYDAAKALSEAHVVAGAEQPGSGIALRWIQRVDALAEAKRLWRLPYGNPNLTRAAASGVWDEVLTGSRIAGSLGDLPTVAVVDDAAQSLI